MIQKHLHLVKAIQTVEIDTFRDRIGTFLRQVDEGVDPADIAGSGEDGLAAQKVIAAAIESLDTETVVYVK